MTGTYRTYNLFENLKYYAAYVLLVLKENGKLSCRCLSLGSVRIVPVRQCVSRRTSDCLSFSPLFHILATSSYRESFDDIRSCHLISSLGFPSEKKEFQTIS